MFGATITFFVIGFTAVAIAKFGASDCEQRRRVAIVKSTSPNGLIENQKVISEIFMLKRGLPVFSLIEFFLHPEF